MTRSSVGFVIFLVVMTGALYGLSRLNQQLNRTEDLSPPTQQEATVAQESHPEGHQHEGHEHEGHEHAEHSAGSESVTVSFPGPQGQQWGSPDAKVKIEAVAPPSDCQLPTLRMLHAIAKADPKRIRVEIYNMNSQAGQQVSSKYGKFCAAVYINGKTQFTLTSNGQTRQVICEKSPGMSYQPTDLIEIVHQELKKAYGKGFDDATLKKLREEGRRIMTGSAPPGEEMVSPEAKVTVEVLTPMQQAPIYNLFASTIRRLEQLKEKHGKDLSVVVIALSTYEGQKRMQALNLTGPAVVINGKTVHEIPGPNNTKQRIITAYGQSPRLFTPEEVVQVVEAYLKQSAKKK